MTKNMALALSTPVSIPSLNPEYHLSSSYGFRPPPPLPSPSDGDDVSLSSPSAPRKALSEGQQFGRYHQEKQQPNIAVKSPSSLSLETIAAFLTTNTEEIVLDSSPPIRSRHFHEFGSTKSRSFPVLKPANHSSLAHQHARPPLRKARSVKFADSKGLPLASVRKLTAADPFQTEGEIVPQLLGDLGALSFTRGKQSSSEKLVASPKAPVRKLNFPQPGTHPEFFTKLKVQSVSLESVSVSQPRAVHGIVRVLNLAYDKDVIIRWTQDKWTTHHNTQCIYCQGSSDGTTDRFSFTLPANGEDIEFAVCYRTKGNEYWDSNNGLNYLITVEDKPQ